ncbi:hypothetical protein ABID29_001544 [Streptococcus rupicaprae]|uniref:Lipoprotein n=1 Tax=Streptococcus rupicaprae TaxID=759619 RepID=A0ABV2FIM7_9STRE
MKKIILSIALGLTLFLSACSSSFSIEGMWRSSGGKIVSFNDGEVSPTLFGFPDGPNGSYSLSEGTDADGNYTLSGTHLTGGNVEYSVEVEDRNHIVLKLKTDNVLSFAPEQLVLERQ